MKENTMMEINIVEKDDVRIAIVEGEESAIRDSETALELIANVFYEHECSRIVIYKSTISEDFFNLSTGVAGDIAQKFTNYRCHVTIVGDYSKYTSASLQAFIYECNRGNVLYFTDSIAEAIERLKR